MSERNDDDRERREPRSQEEREERAEARQAAYWERRDRLAKITQIIWLITSILEALIGVRVLLKLLGANPQAGFAQFIYGVTAVFLAPFLPLFASPQAGASVLELSSLVAMLVYALIAWGIVRIMWISLEEPPRRGGGPGAPAD
jgi:hypothetical protein